MTARKQLNRLVTITVLLVVGLTTLGSVALFVLFNRVQELDSRIAPASAANSQALQAMTDIETGLRGYLLTADLAFLLPVDRGLVAAPTALSKVEAALSDPPTTAAQRRSADAWLNDFARPVSAARLTPRPVSNAEQQAAKIELDTFRADNASLSGVLDARRNELLRQIRAMTLLTAGLLIAGALAGLAVAIPQARRVIKGVGPPLAELSEVVARWRAGQGDLLADEHHGVLEVRAVASGLNALFEENVRVLAEVAERNRLAEVVRTIGRHAGETLSVDEVTDRSVGPVRAGLGADAIWMRTLQGEGEAADRGHGAWLPTDWEGMSAPPSITTLARRLANELWERAGTLTLPAADATEAQPAEHAEILAFLTPLGLGPFSIVPLGAGTECLGYLIVARFTEGKRWSAAEVAALAQVGRDIGRALLHARLFEREREVVARVSALDRQKSEFVSMVSHELRTPITSISGYLELVRDGDVGEVSPEVDGLLDVIERNTFRLRHLIEDLLILSRIESATLTSDQLPVRLEELCEEARAVVAPLAAAQRIDVQIESPPDTPVVIGDYGQLERVVNNLLTNAVKFSLHSGRVLLRLSVTGDWAVLECVDQGIGIPASEQPQLFTRFYRASNAMAQAVPGTGLGLTIVRSIVMQHGGSVDIESVEDCGTTARIRLPLASVGSRAEHAQSVVSYGR